MREEERYWKNRRDTIDKEIIQENFPELKKKTSLKIVPAQEMNKDPHQDSNITIKFQNTTDEKELL